MSLSHSAKSISRGSPHLRFAVAAALKALETYEANPKMEIQEGLSAPWPWILMDFWGAQMAAACGLLCVWAGLSNLLRNISSCYISVEGKETQDVKWYTVENWNGMPKMEVWFRWLSFSNIFIWFFDTVAAQTESSHSFLIQRIAIAGAMESSEKFMALSFSIFILYCIFSYIYHKNQPNVGN